MNYFLITIDFAPFKIKVTYCNMYRFSVYIANNSSYSKKVVQPRPGLVCEEASHPPVS